MNPIKTAKIYKLLSVQNVKDKDVLFKQLVKICKAFEKADIRTFFYLSANEENTYYIAYGMKFHYRVDVNKYLKDPLFKWLEHYLDETKSGYEIIDLTEWYPKTAKEEKAATPGLRIRHSDEDYFVSPKKRPKRKRGVFGVTTLFFHFIEFMKTPVYFYQIKNYHISDCLSAVIRGAARLTIKDWLEDEFFGDEEKTTSDSDPTLAEIKKDVQEVLQLLKEGVNKPNVVNTKVIPTAEPERGQSLFEANKLKSLKPVKPSALSDPDWFSLEQDYNFFMKNELGSEEDFFKYFLSEVRKYRKSPTFTFRGHRASYDSFRKNKTFKEIKNQFPLPESEDEAIPF